MVYNIRFYLVTRSTKNTRVLLRTMNLTHGTKEFTYAYVLNNNNIPTIKIKLHSIGHC